MKKLFMLLLTACLLAGLCAYAEDGLPSPDEVSALEGADSFTVWFEEGFALTLPEGWMRYDVSDADRASGLRYALGDGFGTHFLYIQLTPTGLSDADALESALAACPDYARTGRLTFGGADFVTFIDAARSVSCCATVLGERLAVFIFTPQSDPDYMLAASKLMESFTLA